LQAGGSQRGRTKKEKEDLGSDRLAIKAMDEDEGRKRQKQKNGGCLALKKVDSCLRLAVLSPSEWLRAFPSWFPDRLSLFGTPTQPRSYVFVLFALERLKTTGKHT
jgi:hypothetical protein